MRGEVSPTQQRVGPPEFFTTANAPVVKRSIASVCVSVCPLRTLTFESFDLGTSFVIRITHVYIFRVSRSSSCQGHRVKVKFTGTTMDYTNI